MSFELAPQRVLAAAHGRGEAAQLARNVVGTQPCVADAAQKIVEAPAIQMTQLLMLAELLFQARRIGD